MYHSVCDSISVPLISVKVSPRSASSQHTTPHCQSWAYPSLSSPHPVRYCPLHPVAEGDWRRDPSHLRHWSVVLGDSTLRNLFRNTAFPHSRSGPHCPLALGCGPGIPGALGLTWRGAPGWQAAPSAKPTWHFPAQSAQTRPPPAAATHVRCSISLPSTSCTTLTCHKDSNSGATAPLSSQSICTSFSSLEPHNNTVRRTGTGYCAHFTDQEKEAQRGKQLPKTLQLSGRRGRLCSP